MDSRKYGNSVSLQPNPLPQNKTLSALENLKNSFIVIEYSILQEAEQRAILFETKEFASP